MRIMIILLAILLILALCAGLIYEATVLGRLPVASLIGFVILVLSIAVGTEIGTKKCVNGSEQVLIYENDRNQVKVYKDEDGNYFYVVFGESISKIYSRVYLDKEQVETYIEHIELAGTIDIK